jgi:hypothetical protein
MTVVTAVDVQQYRCQYCDKIFRRESSLAVHLCEPKRRYQERNEIGTQIGLQAYLRFYEMTQGSAKLKNFDDFVQSPYYKAFVNFGRYCQNIRAVNIPRFIEWIIRQNKKIDHWCRDSVYTEYLADYLRRESVTDALARAVEHSVDWHERTKNPARDYLRYGNDNEICYAINSGRISAWVLYNCESGRGFLERINQEQIAMIWSVIDSDFWQKKFHDYAADTEYAREILLQAGW